jgi:hypothetical protein
MMMMMMMMKVSPNCDMTVTIPLGNIRSLSVGQTSQDVYLSGRTACRVAPRFPCGRDLGVSGPCVLSVSRGRRGSAVCRLRPRSLVHLRRSTAAMQINGRGCRVGCLCRWYVLSCSSRIHLYERTCITGWGCTKCIRLDGVLKNFQSRKKHNANQINHHRKASINIVTLPSARILQS